MIKDAFLLLAVLGAFWYGDAYGPRVEREARAAMYTISETMDVTAVIRASQ